MYYLVFVVLMMNFGLTACNTKSQAESYVELSTDEKARRALDERDFELAVEHYKTLLEEDPEDFEIYPYLATAYAALAGFELIEAFKEMIVKGGSASLLDAMGSFLPADPTAAQIEAMALAKQTLLNMPDDHRDKDNAEISYASGAGLQLEFYQSAYAIMYLNQFTAVASDGKLDPAQLEKMTDADVDVILNNLEEVAAQGGEGVPEGAESIITKIDEQPGESRREKLLKYLNP